MNSATWIPLITVALAVVGVVIAVIKFPQERATAVIAQQSTVLADMKSLNDDLGRTADRIRTERDELLKRVAECAEQINGLQLEVAGLRAELRGAMGLNRRHDDTPRPEPGAVGYYRRRDDPGTEAA